MPIRCSRVVTAGRFMRQRCQAVNQAATAMEKETDAERPPWRAGAGRALQPGARQTRLFGLSHVLLAGFLARCSTASRTPKTRRGLARPARPRAIGRGAEVAVLRGGGGEAGARGAEQKRRKSQKRPVFFGGDLGKFVEQAPSLGIRKPVY